MNKKEEINYPKNAKGITLIALVVTIIVLIILAGISINLILGENGIITKAQGTKLINEKGRVIEIVKLSTLNSIIEERGEISKETALTAAFAELAKEGYEVKTVSNVGQQLKGILIQDTTGTEITELNIQQGTETTIKVNLDIEAGTEKHYVSILGKYYEISIIGNEVVIGENGQEEIQGNTYTIKLTPPSTGAKLVVGTSEITEETTIVDGAEITVVAGQNIADYSFNVKVENTTYTEDVTVKVVANPKYATNLTLATTDNVTEVKPGDELQIIATITPDTATDTVEWRVISGSATIDNTGLLKVSDSAEANSTIQIGAKCKRSDGTTSTVEEKNITVTVEANNPSVIEIQGANAVDVRSEIALSVTYDKGTQKDGDIQWTSSNPEVATVDASTGVVTGVNASKGTTTITATYLNDTSVKDEYVITVNPILLGDCSECEEGFIEGYVCPICGAVQSEEPSHNDAPTGCSDCGYYGGSEGEECPDCGSTLMMLPPGSYNFNCFCIVYDDSYYPTIEQAECKECDSGKLYDYGD